MNVAVTLLDGSEIEVECPNGRHTTAEELRVRPISLSLCRFSVSPSFRLSASLSLWLSDALSL